MEEIRIAIASGEDVLVARREGRTFATTIGFTGPDLTYVVTAITEMARNIVDHAERGEILLGADTFGGKKGIVVVARDEGPGIPDVALALTDGYSGRGKLGLGLPGTKRLMDDFDLQSEAGVGTTVTMRRWARTGPTADTKTKPLSSLLSEQSEKRIIRELADQYLASLNEYLGTRDEHALMRAYELGRAALSAGLGAVDAAALQQLAVKDVIARTHDPDEQDRLIDDAEEFIVEGLAPFEMAQQGYREASNELARLTTSLEQEVRDRTRDLEEARLEILRRLALAAEYKDDDTQEHTERVGWRAAMIARILGMPAADVELIWRAASLHDIGKIGVPDAILLKPGKLTDEEWTLIRTHPQMGQGILSGSNSLVLKLGEEISLAHHERWDGTGYPRGLKGEEIPLAARIVSIVDVFDALTNERPYKKAWTWEQAAEEIKRCSGTHFDPKIVDAFLVALDRGFKDEGLAGIADGTAS